MPKAKDETDGALSRFLKRNTVGESAALPLVHSTRSYNIRDIRDRNALNASFCRHFGENLNYLFVGRPAYKRDNDGADAKYWELPCCFIFDSIDDTFIRRIFPFDSGAFSEKKYPDYINFMPIKEFETSEKSAPNRIISAFYGSAEKYFDGNSKELSAFEDEFQLGVLDAEVKALHHLSSDGTPSKMDDRRFSIEIQLGEKIDFSVTPPSAVVLPSIYLRDEKIRSKIVVEWGAEPITYDVFNLSLEHYDGIIYSKVKEFYKSRGLF